MEKEMHCCKRNKMDRFLEVCLLLLLYDEKGYGYGLMDRLENFGFDKDGLNVGSLYATLRKMEGRGLVESGWEEGQAGPKRRVYGITAQGKENLDQWITIFRQRKMRIEKLIDEYTAVKGGES